MPMIWSRMPFLQAYRMLHRYDDHWPFRTWIFTLTHRLAISRAHKAGPHLESPAALAFAPERPAPPSLLEEQEQRDTLWQIARNELSGEQFTAVFLHYVQDMPTAQIADVLGKSWVATKTLLHRARKRLTPFLEDAPAVRAETSASRPNRNPPLARGSL